jgi:uncharacterized protein (DUF2164 family)
LLAYNNPLKENSREQIVDTIKKYLPGQKINMFEFIGSGVGARFYNENLDIGRMVLVEQIKSLHDSFDEKELTCEKFKYRCSAQKFFKTVYPKRYRQQFFNVVNLDFCSWLYDNGTPSCTSKIIDRAFKSGAISEGGLLFCTFQVSGFNLDRYIMSTGKEVPLTTEEHVPLMNKIAEENGYKIKLIFENEYNSATHCRGQGMLNLGFQVEKL